MVEGVVIKIETLAQFAAADTFARAGRGQLRGRGGIEGVGMVCGLVFDFAWHFIGFAAQISSTGSNTEAETGRR
jgi:hypothetical protein